MSALLEESRSIQRGLTCPRASNDFSSVSFLFPKLILQGKVHAALCLLSDHEDGFPLQLDKMIWSKTVWETLLDNHPHGRALDLCARDAGVWLTTEGRRYLGAALGFSEVINSCHCTCLVIVICFVH